MKKIWKYSAIGFLFGLLVLIRAFENELFYDPFLNFFTLSTSPACSSAVMLE